MDCWTGQNKTLKDIILGLGKPQCTSLMRGAVEWTVSLDLRNELESRADYMDYMEFLSKHPHTITDGYFLMIL